MTKKVIEQLCKYIDKMRESLSFISIANMNFDNEPEACIENDSRDWVLFYDECQDFISQFEHEIDMNKLKQALTIRGHCIYETTLTAIERELRRIERQMETSNTKKEEQVNSVKPKKIFISHSTEDKEYVQALVELLEDIGINEEQLFCSSLREYGVKIGEDIYDRLKREFTSYDLWVFFILSDNYYRSAACLNEMGAAWVLQKDYLSVLLPEFNFSDVKGAINPKKIGIKLNDIQIDSVLNDLKDKICDIFGCTISQNRWERVRRAFLNKVIK